MISYHQFGDLVVKFSGASFKKKKKLFDFFDFVFDFIQNLRDFFEEKLLVSLKKIIV